jgi:hypothetical protein
MIVCSVPLTGTFTLSWSVEVKPFTILNKKGCNDTLYRHKTLHSCVNEQWYLILKLARSQHCVLSEQAVLIQRTKLNVYNLFNRSEIQSRSTTLKYKMYRICTVNTTVVPWIQQLCREPKICTVNTTTVLWKQQLYSEHNSCTVNTTVVPRTEEFYREHNNCTVKTTVLPWTQQLYREQKSFTVNTTVVRWKQEL